jgi:hypothetical protein
MVVVGQKGAHRGGRLTVVNSVAGESLTAARTNGHRWRSLGHRATGCLGKHAKWLAQSEEKLEAMVDGGRLTEEEPDGVVARGAALADSSGVEVMLG